MQSGDIIPAQVTVTAANGDQDTFQRSIEVVNAKLRDINGNLWSETEEKMIEKCEIDVPENHFYCIVCKTAVPFSVDGGFNGSLAARGYSCNVHGLDK